MSNKKIERKTIIDLGHSKYWYVVYTDGSYKQIPIIENISTEKDFHLSSEEEDAILETYLEFKNKRGQKRT